MNIRILLMCTVSMKTKEWFDGLQAFRWQCDTSQKIHERWEQEILKASVVHFRSHMFSPSIIPFVFPFYLLTFDLYHLSGQMILLTLLYHNKEKRLWGATSSFHTMYIQSRAKPRNKSASWLVVRHLTPRKGQIHCCHRSGVNGKNRRRTKKMERV